MNQLGTRIEQLANQFGITFNPKVSQEKIDLLIKARETLLVARSELWQREGHRFLLKLDLSMVAAQRQLQVVLSQLFQHRDKEIEHDPVRAIQENLELIRQTLSHVAKPLKSLEGADGELSWYEREYLDGSLSEAKRFIDYLRRESQLRKPGPTDRDIPLE